MKFGIDVGGTTVKIGVVEANKIIEKYEIPTNKETLFEDIGLFLKEYIKKNHIKDIEGIGFGLPGNVVNNYIYNLPNVGIKNVDLTKEMAKYFPNVEVLAQNDANVAALGEMLYHNEYQNACMITLGTGVGCGIVLNGKVLEGSHGAAGEAGHMGIASEYSFACSCGLKGCLETVASATGVVRLAKYHYNDYETQLLESFTAKDVFDLAKKKDPLCLFVVDRVGYYIAKCIAILAVTVDVDVYYIGGGVSKAGDILIDAIQKHYLELSHYAVKYAKIEIAKLLNDAGMLGAAGLITRN
ncbi:MAG: ROK family protein [Roseburia sp.]|nr:ROK family protein [Anaeroplasma bactoclasticum]MCM1196195.1 ROK family protein [Roseburia sp.]MCM1557275.1 ROK family protein [Anaeroplasma bactoclasticum]